MRKYYLSFASLNKFLGGIFTVSDSEQGALAKVTALGINPGGEVLIIEDATDGVHFPLQEFQDKLLDETEMRTMFQGLSQTEAAAQGYELPDNYEVCEEQCNPRNVQ